MEELREIQLVGKSRWFVDVAHSYSKYTQQHCLFAILWLRIV